MWKISIQKRPKDNWEKRYNILLEETKAQSWVIEQQSLKIKELFEKEVNNNDVIGAMSKKIDDLERELYFERNTTDWLARNNIKWEDKDGTQNS